jgi:hypothetical protein
MPIGLIGRRRALAGLAGGMLAGRAAEAQTPARGGSLTVGLSNDAIPPCHRYSVSAALV